MSMIVHRKHPTDSVLRNMDEAVAACTEDLILFRPTVELILRATLGLQPGDTSFNHSNADFQNAEADATRRRIDHARSVLDWFEARLGG